MEEAETAVLVRNARKQYTRKGNFILDGLNMTVRKGEIYGLLGASGCGKTTLLNAIVGMRKIQSGRIRVFGKPPGSSAVKSIGFMPQDIALIGEFSVKGALKHYGWIFGMTDEQIEERYCFLSKLLDLPPSDKLVKQLSGGQQRRVSFAVALVHNPNLLILDEPTVGLDPVLRQNIWDYLVTLAEVEKKSIIITTHYIEEANQAHQLGLMRNGKILAEGAPKELRTKFECSSVEDVFLLLSQRQQQGFFETKDCLPKEGAEELADYIGASEPGKTVSFWDTICFTTRGHSKALLSKNFLRYKRHPGTLLFAFVFPIIQISTFFLAVGRIPNDLKLGVVNDELGNYTDCVSYRAYNPAAGYILSDNETCEYSGLSCRFLDSIGPKIKEIVYYRTFDEAMEAVKTNKIHTFIRFPHNYTEAVALVRNIPATKDVSDYELEFQEIEVYRDVIDHSLSDIMMKELYESFGRYLELLAVDCNKNPRYEHIPIYFNEPVYGSDDLTYRDLIAPGMIGLVAVFLTLGLSTSTVTMERTEGIWERTIISGVTPTEILIFHTITLSVVSIFQIIELFVISFAIFDLDCKGDKLTVFLLVYIQSIAGISFGITISVMAKTVTDANYASLGLFYPFITLSGCFWPIESMPTYLRYLSYFVPLTITSQSLSNVIHRGWGFTHFHVYKGMLASIGFLCTFTLISSILLRLEKRK